MLVPALLIILFILQRPILIINLLFGFAILLTTSGGRGVWIQVPFIRELDNTTEHKARVYTEMVKPS